MTALICWLLSSSAVTSAHMPTVCALGVEMGMALACAPGVTAHATSCPMAEAPSTSRAIASVLACTCAKMCTASPRAADKSARAIGGASSDLTPISNNARAARRRARRSAGTWTPGSCGTPAPAALHGAWQGGGRVSKAQSIWRGSPRSHNRAVEAV